MPKSAINSHILEENIIYSIEQFFSGVAEFSYPCDGRTPKFLENQDSIEPISHADPKRILKCDDKCCKVIKVFDGIHLIISIMIETTRCTAVTESAETAFPFKLHIVLDEAEKQGFSDVISWQGSNAFMVHKPKKFEDSVMKEYFNQTLYRSFQKQRKLQTWYLLFTLGCSVFQSFVLTDRFLTRPSFNTKYVNAQQQWNFTASNV